MSNEKMDAAVRSGFRMENGAYTFYDPGISLVDLSDLWLVRRKSLMLAQDWYEQDPWAQRKNSPQHRHLRIPVPDSFNKNFSEQVVLLSPEEEVASVRTVATFLILHFLVTDQRLLADHCVRCSDTDSGGLRVCVGSFDRDGLFVGYDWDGRRPSALGLASARKS